MSERDPGAGGSVSGRPAMIELDRRDFLKLAAAAGMTAAGSPWLSATAFGQSQSPSASGEPAAAVDPIADLAASLGHDIERIFRFVQEEIRYEPYAGVLRGARGTLAVRAGNSADQSVLLGALLGASSVAHRFVTGRLDDGTAAGLLASSATDVATAAQQTQQGLLGDSPAPPASPIAPSPVPSVSPALDTARLEASLRADATAALPAATRQLDDSIDLLTTALASAGIQLPNAATALPELERDAHVWVQAGEGSDWHDLDPSLPDIPPGERPASPGEVLESIPDELRHRLEFTVTTETLSGGALAPEVILEYSGFADELAGTGIIFTHTRSDELGSVDIIRAGLGSTAEYSPVLVVGPTTWAGRRTVVIGASGDDIFGGALGGGGLVDGETLAEWLDLRISSPGIQPVTVRRSVFDRIGPVAREGGSVDLYALPVAELVDLGSDMQGEYPPCRVAHAFSVANGITDIGSRAGASEEPGVSALSLLADGYHAARDTLQIALAHDRGCRPFIDAPNLVACTLRPSAEGVSLGLDIWHRSFGTLGLVDRQSEVSPSLVAGLLAHVVERVTMGDGVSPANADPGVVRMSVGSIFEMAAAQGLRPRVLSESLPEGLPYGPEEISRLRTALERGLVVVVPEEAVVVDGRPRLGWWLVDPASGRAVDELVDGTGQSTVENIVVTVSTSLRVWSCLVTFFAFGVEFLKQFLPSILGPGDLAVVSMVIDNMLRAWTFLGIIRAAEFAFHATVCITGAVP